VYPYLNSSFSIRIQNWLWRISKYVVSDPDSKIIVSDSQHWAEGAWPASDNLGSRL
jgi:hypothetical protein